MMKFVLPLVLTLAALAGLYLGLAPEAGPSVLPPAAQAAGFSAATRETQATHVSSAGERSAGAVAASGPRGLVSAGLIGAAGLLLPVGLAVGFAAALLCRRPATLRRAGGALDASPEDRRFRPAGYAIMLLVLAFGLGCTLTSLLTRDPSEAQPGASHKTEEYDPGTDTWTTKAPMLAGRLQYGLAATGGKLYAAGGSPGISILFDSPINPVATLEVYDPVANTWAMKAPMPTARYAVRLAELFGRLYAVGGTRGSPRFPPSPFPAYVSTVEAYDPGTNTWTTRAPMGTPHCEVRVAVLSGTLFAIGANEDNCKLATGVSMEAYNPIANTWVPKAAISQERERFGFAAANGKLYAVGGESTANSPVVQVFATVEEYDPVANTWTTKAPMPTPRYDLALAVGPTGKLYAVGGRFNFDDFLTTVEEYDPVANTWATKAPMPTGRLDPGLVAANGKLYAVGGHIPDMTMENLSQGGPIQDGANTAPSIASGTGLVARATAGVRPTIAYDTEMVALPDGSHLFIGGAGADGCAVNEIWKQGPAAPSSNGDFSAPGVWSRAGTLLTGTVGGRAVLLPDGSVLVSGGQVGCDPNSATARVERLLPQPDGTFSATVQQSMPFSRTEHLMTRIPGTSLVLVAGGTNSAFGTLRQVEIYSPTANIWVNITDMNKNRKRSQAVWLPTGKLLVVGGIVPLDQNLPNGTQVVASSAETYDPSLNDNEWADTGTMQTARVLHTLTVLRNGTALAAGGTTNVFSPTSTLSSTEVYSPVSGTWSPAGTLSAARADHTASLVDGTMALGLAALQSGAGLVSALTEVPTSTVMLLGGKGTNGKALGTGEMWDPTTNTWATLPGALDNPRYGHATYLDGLRIATMFGRTEISGSQVITSEEFSGLNSMLQGPHVAFASIPYSYTALVLSVFPLTLTTPITYVWRATGYPPITHTGSVSDTVGYSWPVTGSYAITVTLANRFGQTLTNTLSVEVPGAEPPPNPTATPSPTASPTARPAQRTFLVVGFDAYNSGW